MAHHQGMTLVSLANVLLDATLRRRFHREPLIRASGILLQETRHRDASIALPRADQEEAALVDDGRLAFEERLHSPHLPRPSTQLMSNGRYAVMMTAAGAGYSQWRDVGVTRWREDPTCDDHGSFIYLRDTSDGRVWSAGYQPVCVEPASYDVAFHEDRVRIVRQDGTIETTLEVIVSAEDDAEIRRLTLRNLGTRRERDRDHVVRRDHADAARGGSRAPGVLQPLRPQRVRAAGFRADLLAPAARLDRPRSSSGRT